MCEAVRSMMLLIYTNHTPAKLQKIYIPRAFMPQKTLMARGLIAFGLPASFGLKKHNRNRGALAFIMELRNFALQSMDKQLNIFTNIILSILIVYMSVGITMVHCRHHGEMMFAEMAELTPTDNDGCHKATSNCMTKTVLKLSPSSAADSTYFDFQAMQTVSALIDDMLGIPFEITNVTNPHIARVMPHGPPADYLHFIRVLRL